ncbi:MAG: type II toxin-antitoxin system RelE/ParE family toxin [Acidobacteriota bacterium]
MAYKVVVKPSAQRDLDSLDEREVERIALRVAHLTDEPRPFGVQKLTSTGGYRIRVGNYRVLYEVSDSRRQVSIYRVKHRRDAYRRSRH